MLIYGRVFININGLGQVYFGVGGGSWENGVWDYKDLFKFGVQVVYDVVVSVMYSYDLVKREFIFFDMVEMIQRKVVYFKQRGFGGSMFWEVFVDWIDGQSLIGISFWELGGIDLSLNQFRFFDSQYENLWVGFV